MPGTLFVVATPIGNLEDITVRALRILREVAVIAAEDTRRTAQLLARHAIVTPLTSLHEHNEATKSAPLIARLQTGESIALVSDAGTPTVSDPGGVLIRTAIDAGLRVEPVPGPSSVLAAISVAGLPTSSFYFLGFPPTRSNDRVKWFERMERVAGTVVFFESPHRIQRTLQELARRLPHADVVICRELTKIHETVVRSPIESLDVATLPEKGEFTVVLNIGETTYIETCATPSGESLLLELGELTKHLGVSRRKAINALGRKYGLPPNELYEMIESAKKSGL
jgi:16S rRNA (cytidine1402-2'-O)-methyltransferase